MRVGVLGHECGLAGGFDEGTGMMRWEDVPVYLHRKPVDFRKSINGLSLLVEQGMGMSPFREALFVFGARRRDKVKVLYWDQTGFCLWYKRLEKDRFRWPKEAESDVVRLSAEQFDWLLRGLDILKMKPHVAKKFDEM
jgi:transposase